MKIGISSISVLDSLGNDLSSNFDKICLGHIGKKTFQENFIGFPIDNTLLENICNSIEIENVRHVKSWHKAGVAVATEAIEKSDLNTDRVSIAIGSCLQGMMYFPEHLDFIAKRGKAHPRYLFDINTHSIGALLNFKHKFKNGTCVYNSACATGLYLLETAVNQLLLGKTDAVVVLGIDFACDRTNLHFFESLGAVSKKGNSHPYHELRDGFLPGDGVCAMVIEPVEKILARNKEPLAIIDSCETASENYSLFAPDMNGEGINNILSRFIKEELDSIDLIATHATGTQIGDFIEYDTIQKILNKPTVAFKGFIGHTQAAAGLLETAYSIMSMNTNRIPGMPWLTDSNNKNDNLNHKTISQNINSFLKVSIGFNGSLTAAKMSKV